MIQLTRFFIQTNLPLIPLGVITLSVVPFSALLIAKDSCASELETLAGVEERVAFRNDDGEAVDDVVLGGVVQTTGWNDGLRRRVEEVVTDELAEHGEELVAIAANVGVGVERSAHQSRVRKPVAGVALNRPRGWT